MKVIIALLMATVLVGAPRGADARTLYVDGGCTTSGSGLALACGANGPFKTIGEGIEAMVAGDTLNIRGRHGAFSGAYNEQLYLKGNGNGPIPGKALDCSASPCVIQGCRASSCGQDEVPIIRAMRLHPGQWRNESGSGASRVYSVAPGAAPTTNAGQRDDTDPHMVMEGVDPEAAPLYTMPYDGDGNTAPRDGRWTYHLSSKRVYVNPTGDGAPDSTVWIPNYSYQVQLWSGSGCDETTCPENVNLTLQYLKFEGTKFQGISAIRQGGSNTMRNLTFRHLVQQFVSEHFFNPFRVTNLVFSNNLAEYGCRGISHKFRGATSCFGYRVSHITNLTMENNVLRHFGAAGERPENDSDLECPWCDPPWNTWGFTRYGMNGNCLDIKQTDTGRIAGNLCQDMAFTGIQSDVSRNLVVENNVVLGARSGLMIANFTADARCPTTDPSAYCYNQNNVFRNNSIDTAGFNTMTSCGIVVSGEGSFHSGGTFHSQIYNNTISRSAYGGICLNGNSTRPIDGLYVWNNTVSGTHPFRPQATAGIRINSAFSRTVVRNNIFANVNEYGAQVTSSAAGDVTLNNNGYWSTGTCDIHWSGACTSVGSRPGGQEANGFYGDPLFVNPGAAPPDLHLQSGSAAIGRGVVLPEFSFDKDGLARPTNQPWDVGAYQFSERSGLAPPTLVEVEVSP